MAERMRERRRKAFGGRKLGFLALLPIMGVLVATFAVSASGTTASCSNTASLTNSAFEIDANANLAVNTAGCIDWLTGASGTALRAGVLTTNDKPSGASDDSFGNGSSENDANLTIVAGSIPPNKSDLKKFGVFTEAGANNTKFLQLFWTRVNNPSGSTNMDFELNQKFCDPSANPTNCMNNGAGVTPETPVRTNGDKLITYDLAGGGTVPTISIRTWSGSSWGPATTLSGGAGATALGSVNTSALSAADTSFGAQDPFTFGEASISYAALFPAGTACGSLGSAYLKSRSSTSFSAEIKDFIAPERVSISNCTTLTTQAGAATATVGDSISDTATLGGAVNPTGSITFKLYRFPLTDTASGDACDAAHLVTTLTSNSPFTASGNNVTASQSYSTTLTGRYRWVASYTSGDANNVNAGPTACQDPLELTTVGKASPGIGTTPNPSSGSIGATLNDSATVSGGSSPTGNVTFNLYDPDQSGCTGTPRFTDTEPLSGGSASTVTGFVSDKAGTWRWTATYNGDGNNNTATSGCNDEQVALKASPSISTTPSSGGVVGISLTDSATLTNGLNPTGTVTFKLYDNATCTAGALRDTQQLPVGAASAGPTSGFATDHTGTWSWTADYSGDGANNPASSGCTQEQVTIGPASPTINTTPSGGGVVGVSISDSATVTGGFNPTGTVTFSLFDDATCTNQRATQTISLSGGSAGPTKSFLTDHTGTWSWVATYNGDGNNNTAASGCTAEQVTITRADTDRATLQNMLPNDKMTLTSSFGGITGTVDFRLFGPDNPTCDKNGSAPVYQELNVPVASNSAQTSNTATKVSTPGTYRWLVVYSGDANHNGSTSACGVENFTIDNGS